MVQDAGMQGCRLGMQELQGGDVRGAGWAREGCRMRMQRFQDGM